MIPQPGLPWGSYGSERNQSALHGGSGCPSSGELVPRVDVDDERIFNLCIWYTPKSMYL